MFGVNPHTTVIIVPDDINEFSTVRPDMRALVHQNMVAMSCDNLRMYVRIRRGRRCRRATR